MVKAVASGTPAFKRWPISVYRLQFNRTFTFRDATRLVSYLHELGITDCYASPYLKARAGSQHGYDISDHNYLNPEIGSQPDYDHFISQLQKYGMGHVLDFVPNHMGIFDNPKWQDVLENGPSSIYARFFDIDWEPVKTELHQKVLLPILEDLYGDVLEKGQIILSFKKGAFAINYYEHRLPVGPKTTVAILEPSLEKLRAMLGDVHPDYLELQSIVTACKNLPERSDVKQERMAERHREKEIIKRRLAEVCAKNEAIKKAIEEVVTSINGTAGDSASFSRLHELLENQAYRLSYWRVAAEEINYRRFFDINELVALRMEDPLVFQESHRLIRELIDSGSLTGVRFDHVDGLFDPADYLWRIQKGRWLNLARGKSAHLPPSDSAILDEKLDAWFEHERIANPDSPALRPLFMVVEKILGEKEALREIWPVDGTTGYEFSASLNQIFVDKKHERAMLEAYRRFTGTNLSFREIVYQCKSLVMKTTMAAEINLLAHELNRVSERSWQYRDFTLNSLRDAIREVIACFPVYRTYINAYQELVDDRDKKVVDTAALEAKRRNPAVSSAIFDFVKNTLLLQYPAGMDKAGRNEQRLFVMRFQQFTGPVTAKGVEDTAFYIYHPLVSMCEVGGYPERFGAPVGEFHRQNIQRHQAQPYSFVTTSTHDSKRGEDVRARINVLSEIPREWRSALARWSRLNVSKKSIIDGEPVPDRNEEYLTYQTLLGTYPVPEMSDEESAVYSGRIQSYMLKAIREAKVHTSWISPHTSYEEGVTRFVKAILEPSPSNQFLTDFLVLNKLVAICGMYNSLSQVVLKIFSPGVPDIYQGNELWAFNLTDPDNRQKVDFKYRARLLGQLKKTIAASKLPLVTRELMKTSHDGRVKLYVTWRSLTYRRDNITLFDGGSYTPLKAAGAQKNHLCTFTRGKGGQRLIVAIPRLVARLTRNGTIAPEGNEVWSDTHIILPRPKGQKYQNIFTGETVSVQRGSSALFLADVFRTFPVAALELIN
ncbi:MAG: malto-oligosyltrehalose synthase [Chloroflexi bacterium RBG_16_50_9]|nr:MAG: malto-oligosyltrehalose synthase [Chloroflexi bacterium RBG_16_50_9]